ncbi:MAG: hypothetical protein LC793_11740 [Thermomicrobia bacterium]|nr:hypothetical protein [Thermomicrobia bacterium]
MRIGLVALLVILFFALGIVVKSGRTLAFDERAHRFVRGPVPTAFEEDDTSLRTRFMHLGPDIGTATILFVPLTALALIGVHRRRAAALMIASPVGALVLTLCMKGIFQRTRAEHVCRHGPLCVIGYLFPSTHTVPDGRCLVDPFGMDIEERCKRYCVHREVDMHFGMDF